MPVHRPPPPAPRFRSFPGMAQHQPIRKTNPPSGSDIPDKLYFRIGEVARLCDVPAYVLRFWESEFPQLKPHKGGTGQRLYRRRDVEMALRIKSLLYSEGYTIPGARQVFKAELKQKEPQLALAIDNAAPSVDARQFTLSAHRVTRALLAAQQRSSSTFHLSRKTTNAEDEIQE